MATKETQTITSADIATVPAGAVATAANPRGQLMNREEVLSFLNGDHVNLTADPEEATKSIISAALAADTVEDLFGEREVTHAADFIRHPFVLKGLKWQKSTLKASQVPFFAVLDVVDNDGSPRVVTIGGLTAMAKLFKLESAPQMWAQLGDTRLMITQKEEATAAGYYPLDLVFAPKS